MSASAPALSTMLERDTPWLYCNGRQFKQLIKASLDWLDVNHKSINDLNVFPVPDGDSGTNMLLTMKSAYAEIAEINTLSISEILQHVARGALMGARGNSGVILSQWWRGLANALHGKEAFNANEWAFALHEGSKLAYQGVQKPVEGTILTVVRETAEAVSEASAHTPDLNRLWDIATTEAHNSVKRTPEIFPLLKKAGVVDSGGQGFAVILQGALMLLNGERIEISLSDASTRDVSELEAEHGYGFDIQCLISGANLDVSVIRARIESMGESTLVVGDDRLIKVHTHAPMPGSILDYCISCGVVTDIVVENMEAQYEEIKRKQAVTIKATPLASEHISGIATIAVVSGQGLQETFESLGASRIVTGGATMNPSIQDILQAIEAVETPDVIVMPNDKNILLAAQHAAQNTHKNVRIVPSVTIPQGIAALLAFNFQSDLERNTEAMIRALKNVTTGELTHAVRSVSIDGVDVAQGQIIGLLDGKLVLSANQLEQASMRLLEKMNVAAAEVVTLYYGQDINEAQAQQLAGIIQKQYEHLQIEVVNGGQPHIHYIFSAE